MKQLLSVLATVMFVYFSMAFTVVNNRGNLTKAVSLHQKEITKWKYTTWVNPWLTASESKKIALANNIIAVNYTDLNILHECKLTFSGGEIDLMAPGYVIKEIPTAQPVTFTGEVDGSNGNIIVVQLNAVYSNQMVYFHTGEPTASFQWTPEPGEYYVLTIEDF